MDNLGFGPYVSASAGRSERLRQGVHRLICLTEDNQRPRSLYEQRLVVRRLHQSRVGREDCQRPLEVGSGLGIGVQQERLSPSCRCVAHCGCPHPGGLRVACQFSGRDPFSFQRAQRLPVKHLPPRCGDTGIDRLTHEIVWKAQEALVLKKEPTRQEFLDIRHQRCLVSEHRGEQSWTEGALEDRCRFQETLGSERRSVAAAQNGLL